MNNFVPIGYIHRTPLPPGLYCKAYTPCSEPSRTFLLHDVKYTMYARHLF